MRDFPVFSTENGVGSLVLKEIPYNGAAYITIHSSAFPTEFLHECVEFCRAVGAARIYACGHDCLKQYPLFTTVVQMSASVQSLPDTDACLFPVTERTVERWCQIYNEKMKAVHNAAYMSRAAAQKLLQRGGAYFVHENQKLLGIGIAFDDRIECVASVLPGSGKHIVAALTHALLCDRVMLEVASTNRKAIRLYESLGFIQTAVLSEWYEII